MSNLFKNIENLVFQGGGVKGIAYLGAMQELTKNENESHLQLSQIKRIGGASAGAITAFLLAIGNGVEQVNNIFNNLDFSDLLDEGSVLQNFTTKQAVLKLNEIAGSNSDKTLDYVVYIICEVSCSLARVNLPALTLEKVKEGIEKGIIGGGVIKKLVRDKNLLKLIEESIDDIKALILNRLSNINLEQLHREVLALFKNQQEWQDFIVSLSKIASRLTTGERGVFEGKVFLDWIQKQLKDKKIDPEITFAEFEGLVKHRSDLKELYVVVLNLSSGIAELFSHKNESTRHVLICDAIRASMSIPYFFEPADVRYKSGTTIQKKSDLYADGGVLENYPIWIFDSSEYTGSHSIFRQINRREFNYKTLGFRLVTSDQKKFFEDRYPINPGVNSKANLISYTGALASAVFNKQESDHYHSGNLARTVYIDTLDVSFVDFGMSTETKNKLIVSGVQGVRDFVARQWPEAYETSLMSFGDAILRGGSFGSLTLVPTVLLLGFKDYFSKNGLSLKLLPFLNGLSIGLARYIINMSSTPAMSSGDKEAKKIILHEGEKNLGTTFISAIMNFSVLFLASGKISAKEAAFIAFCLSTGLAVCNAFIHQAIEEYENVEVEKYLKRYCPR